MKQVLLISPQPFFQWRGSPIRVGFNILALAELGYGVDLLTLPIGEEKDTPGVNIIRVPNWFGVRNVAIGPSLVKAGFDVLLFFKGLHLMQKKRYDVIHGIEEAGAVALMLRPWSNSRIVYEKHSDPFSYKKGPFKNLLLALYGRVEKLTAHHADAVICTGRGLVKQVLNAGARGPVHHIFDIPSSLAEPAPERIKRLVRRYKQKLEEVLITYVGSFAVYQGVDLMFDAIPQVIKGDQRARFIIIGGDTSEIERRRRKLADQGCQSAVSFVGKVPPETLPDYLSASDILLAPRLSGVNTPLKLLDYLKSGQAIVATDVTANRLILDETNACFVSPEPSALSQGILNLVDNQLLRRRLGTAGHDLYLEKYNYDEFKRRIGICYQDLFETDPRTGMKGRREFSAGRTHAVDI